MRLRVVGAAAAAAVVAFVGGACDSGEDSSSDTTATSGGPSTLPLPASNAPPTTLQFRAVLGEAGECPAHSENPAPGGATSILYRNQCLSLTPSALTVQKADVVAVPTAAGPAVQITLRGGDVATFAKVSQDYLGRTIALVAFGKVMATPQLGQQILDGRVEITGLSQNEAADLKAALD